MSTPPVLAHITGTCSEHRPECIRHAQRVLFYTALPLIALGFAGHMTCLMTFLADQLSEEDEDDVDQGTFWLSLFECLSHRNLHRYCSLGTPLR